MCGAVLGKGDHVVEPRRETIRWRELEASVASMQIDTESDPQTDTQTMSQAKNDDEAEAEEREDNFGRRQTSVDIVPVEPDVDSDEDDDDFHAEFLLVIIFFPYFGLLQMLSLCI